ncbi:MAG: T9SS type A sorting domain-containing protein [Bacteroidia bacterium]|nr:T9SS type A sorting domain-containing protein [Bacteroidia bacterium]
MKKFTLAVIAAVSIAGSLVAQPNITLQAPPANSSSQLRAPNGMIDTKYQNACYLVRASELTSLTGTNITHIGFSLVDGTGSVPVTGNFTVYLQNAADVTYNKGTNFTNALTGMSTNYVGTITMPVGTAPSTILLTLTTPFVYTGGAIYVAFSHDAAGPFDTANPSTIDANNSLTNGGATAASSITPNPNTMTLSNFRPAFLFQAVNTATNEISVTNLKAPGKVAQSLNTGHSITVDVKNGSVGTLTNIAVGLLVTGANNFTDSQVIPSLAGGAATTVTFATFNPQNSGLNTISVSVLPDQFPNNNTASWSQSVTCSTYAGNPPVGTYSGSIGFGTGGTGLGIVSARYTQPVTADLKGIRGAISTNAATPGNLIYGVLLDQAGAVLATTQTVTIGSTMLGSYVQFDFPSLQNIAAGTVYHIGLAQTQNATGYYPFASLPASPAPTNYFSCPIAGGAYVSLVPLSAHFGIEAVFTSTNPVLTVTPSKTVICKGEPVTLTASGGVSYVWNNNATTAAVVVSPTATTGYTVTGTDANGCVNSKTYTQTVAPCLGLTANANDGQEILLFPNPAVNGKTTVSGLEGTNTVSLYNVLGQLISTQVVTSESVEINLNNQPSGNYLIKITNNYNQTKTLKFLNQN